MEDTFLFCPHCGGDIRLEKIKEGEPDRHRCMSCEVIHFLGPKLAAGVILLHDDKIVLGRRDIQPGRGLWTYPGGFVERGELVDEAARREAKEELCADVELQGLLGVYSYPRTEVAIAIYLGKSIGPEPKAGDEVTEAGFFKADETSIPWNELAFRSVRDSLQDFLKNQKRA